jgi:aminoglycoside phosphotransferase (APT) family kinase protein
MSDVPISDYDEAGVERLRAFTEHVTGGRVVDMVRQIRWRPSWYATIERNGQTSQVYIRGDRQSDVMPFPELRREADILEVLYEHGIPVPRIYGVCENPQAIVMDSLPGERDIANAGSDAERAEIVRQYIEAVSRMHQLPVAPFVARGLQCPVGEEAIALAGVNAYLPLYRRTKAKPEPLIEFALRWLLENVPPGRTEACLVQFDSGQYHFANGQMIGLYDFEFAMIADPLADLATMRMRESNEPLGEDMRVACRHYEAFTGKPIDHRALAYHTLVFATVATMQFSSTVAKPQPGAPHAVYLEFDLALRRTLILTLAECLGLDLPAPEPRPDPQPLVAPFADMLADMIGQFALDDPLQRSGQEAALQVIEMMRAQDAFGAWMVRRDLEDAEALLGRSFESHEAMLQALEEAIVSGSELDTAAWFKLFAGQEGRKLVAYGGTAIAGSATKAFIPPSS